jgi:hypothetical protein
MLEPCWLKSLDYAGFRPSFQQLLRGALKCPGQLTGLRQPRQPLSWCYPPLGGELHIGVQF